MSANEHQSDASATDSDTCSNPAVESNDNAGRIAFTAEEVLPLLEAQREQIRSLEARLPAAAGGPAVLQSQAAPVDYMALKVGVARLSEAPTNWHQATVYALSSTAPEDQQLRQRGPAVLAISTGIVMLQLITIFAAMTTALSSPCSNSNADCPREGTFCKPSGSVDIPECATCGNYGPMGYEYDESSGQLYNQMMLDGFTKDPEFAGFNMTHVEMICADPSLSVGLTGYIAAAKCFSVVPDAPSKRFEDRFEPTICPGADGLGEPSPNYEEWVKLWCTACVVPDGTGGFTVPSVTRHDLQIHNIEAMRTTDWLTFFFCSLLVSLTMVGEIKDIQLCLYQIARAREQISNINRCIMLGVLLIRRWTFMPLLMVVIVALVTSQGGSALQVCFNTIAILFVCDIDNIAYRFGLPEGVRGRVEVHGRCELNAAQAAALWRSKLVHVIMIPVATMAMTMATSYVGTFGYMLSIVGLTIAAFIEEFGDDEIARDEMINSFGKGGTGGWRCFDVLCSLILGLVGLFALGIFYMLLTREW